MRKPLEYRFWQKVIRGESHECWLWTGCQDGYGYGAISEHRYTWRASKAHRVSWELHNGAIPRDLCVLHHCDVRICVNPQHLFLGTRGDNARDAAQKGRMSKIPRRNNVTLKEKDVMLIRELRRRKCPVTAKRLGDWFGVSGSAVSHIWHNRKWKHLPLC